MLFLKLAFIALAITCAATSEPSFSDFKKEVEANVKELAEVIEENNAYSPSNCDCTTQSFYDECVGVNEAVCYENFPKHLSCLGFGVQMSETLTFRLCKQKNKYRLKC